MAARNYKRWFVGILLVFIGVAPLLVAIYRAIFCNPFHGICYPTYVMLPAIGIAFLGLLLPVVGRRRQHARRFDMIQNYIFAVIFILIGAILFFNGLRLDPVLQLTTWLLIESVIYWIFKDLNR